jgi:hypothetical protein
MRSKAGASSGEVAGFFVDDARSKASTTLRLRSGQAEDTKVYEGGRWRGKWNGIMASMIGTLKIDKAGRILLPKAVRHVED